MWIIVTISNNDETLSRILHMPKGADLMQKMVVGRMFWDGMGKQCARLIHNEATDEYYKDKKPEGQ